jgi:pimeloyl-ACP methyl ester carboxylesterase
MNRTFVLALWLAMPAALLSQTPAVDSSAHTQRFVTVEPGVQLEVLDWGGVGQPLVFLAGRGNTAHVFDRFATLFGGDFRVLGITRRGFGNSTRATSGYLADSLANDVLAALDSLGIQTPVLIGHSLAGQELSSIGSRHPERVAGLVYLDAGDHFAFYDSTGGHAPALLRDTQRKLALLNDPSVGMTLRDRGALIGQLLERLPIVASDLRLWQQELASIPDQSRIVPSPVSDPVNRALAMGQQVFTSIRARVLAFFALPSQPPARLANDSLARATFFAIRSRELARIRAFERGIPGARVVILADADHYVFRSHEADVLRDTRAFLANLSNTVALTAEPAACRPAAESLMFVVDGKMSTCGSAMALERSGIASVDVLKGAAAAAQYPTAGGQAVVVIQTKRTP